MGSLVGQTEERTRQALRIVDAMAPCVLFIDEIEKALAGVQSSGQTDSGVSARMFGTMLVLAQRPRERRLRRRHHQRREQAAAGVQPGRALDGIFFIDLPGQRETGCDLADVPGEVRPRPRPAPSRRS